MSRGARRGVDFSGFAMNWNVTCHVTLKDTLINLLHRTLLNLINGFGIVMDYGIKIWAGKLKIRHGWRSFGNFA